MKGRRTLRDVSPRRLAAITTLLLALAFAGCGDEEPASGGEATAPQGTEDPEVVAPQGPSGPLRPDGIGELDFGDPVRVVRATFGVPDRREEVNFGGGKAPRVDWIYRSEPGLRIVFDNTRKTLSGYQCSGRCSLETEEGFGLGDEIAEVKREHGDELRPYPIGDGALFLPADDDELGGGIIFSSSPPGKGELISLAAFDTLAGPAGD